MKKEEALQHFKENYVKKKSNEKILELEDYYKSNKECLTVEFIQSFKEICTKIKEMQLRKEKEKIAYITYSMLRTEIADKKYDYLIEAFNMNWFLDKKECQIKYDASWAFKFLEEFEADIEQKRKIYAGLITISDVENIKQKETEKYNQYVGKLARYTIGQAEKLPEFQAINKDAELEIRVGEYRDVSEVVYKEDRRKKDPEEIKEWLEEKLKHKYTYEVLNDLDLSKADYEGIDLKYSDLRKNNFSESNMKNCILVGVKFNECNLKNIDFSKSFIHEADFRNCDLKGSSFYFAQGPSGIANKVEWDMPGFDGVNFEDADLEGVNFQNANLKGAVFKGANLKDVNFKETNLENAVFMEKDLDVLELDEEQLKVITIEK